MSVLGLKNEENFILCFKLNKTGPHEYYIPILLFSEDHFKTILMFVGPTVQILADFALYISSAEVKNHKNCNLKPKYVQ